MRRLLSPHQVRYLSGENSPTLAREGHIRLRDSFSRFFIPQYSGPRHDRRQQLLVTDGVLKPKMSAAIGIDRRDLLSYGVEDQFSHSDYTPKEPCRVRYEDAPLVSRPRRIITGGKAQSR
jgi:hypothetical protein